MASSATVQATSGIGADDYLTKPFGVGELLARVRATLRRQRHPEADSADRVVSNPQLLRAVWGPGQAENGHYLRVYMGHLRHKLEDDPTQPRYLQTEAGVGYRLQLPA